MANQNLGEILENEPMSKHTSWRTGGSVDRYYKPKDKASLIEFMRQLPDEEPLYWVGLGSNLLVRDGGIRGTVIAHIGRLDTIRIEDKNCYAEVGVTCAKVARLSAKQGLSGAEFLAGIPGTMGGALAMNAGAFGGETWNIVSSVEMLKRNGETVERTPNDFKIGYRSVVRDEFEWFLSVNLVLEKTDDESSLVRIKQLLNRRGETQPTDKPTCGSVFKNPQGQHAAQLIESSGLKGYRLGGACVSEKHANFIENINNATSLDIESLILYVQSTVKEKTGIQLQPEVKIMGNPG